MIKQLFGGRSRPRTRIPSNLESPAPATHRHSLGSFRERELKVLESTQGTVWN